MTVTEKQAYLEEYKHLVRKIDYLLESSHFWYEKAITIPIAKYDLSGVHAHNRPKYSVVEQFMIHHEELDKEASEIMREVKKIEETIEQVDKPEYEEVLRLRYINGYSYAKIANTLGITLRQVHRIMVEALENLEISEKCH